VRERLLGLLEVSEHRAQAAELLRTLDDPELWALAEASIERTAATFWGMEGESIDPSWWPLVRGRVPRLIVRNATVERLPDWADEVVLEHCELLDGRSGPRRLVLVACTTPPLGAFEELVLHWPASPVQVDPGCGVLRVAALKQPGPVRLEARELTLHWVLQAESVHLRGERIQVAGADATVGLDGPASLLRVRGHDDAFLATGEVPQDQILESLHATLGHSWPRWIGWGTVLLPLGARWVADWSDDDGILLQKQPQWEDLLAAFRGYPQAPDAAADSYLGAFGRNSARAERFLNRTFHNPWGLNERTFGRSGVPALARLVEHPRCLNRDAVRRTAERLVGVE